tara:strand:+ start:1298 stop:1480 length:183 start_codon:yes stop_codon:yes gene_type:complete
MKYNHAVTLAFEVISDDANGNDITPAMLKEALLQRMVNLDMSDEWLEAVGAPYDTHEDAA